MVFCTGSSVLVKFRVPLKLSTLFLSESRKKRRAPNITGFSVTSTTTSVRERRREGGEERGSAREEGDEREEGG